jgi:two-component system, OmpR family, sensor histidine kinase RstB
MRRLHLKLYLAIVGTMLVFAVACAVAWHHFAPSRNSMSEIETATGLAAALVENAPDPGQRAQILDSLGRQLHADVAMFPSAGAAPSYRHGDGLLVTPEQIATSGWSLSHGGPYYNVRLAGGGQLVVRPRRRLLIHGLHMGLLLTGVAGILALLTYPIARGITARLERLRGSMQEFGNGNLAVRVPVEGRDEIAALARSFNDSAGRIETLVAAHKLLLANCSHELRTPLARMRLAIERLPEGERAANPELVRGIVDLDALIGEMLLSSRLDASAPLDRQEAIDLPALVAEEAAHFDSDVVAVPVTVHGDPTLIRRLVRNLLDNARVHAGGATAVRVDADERAARIIVEDAGAGVPEADRERIFEPFYRSASAARGSGSGLGLAIVRQIATAHGGRVDCAAREGGGSRFTVLLPR